jgi:hypothetical protein
MNFLSLSFERDDDNTAELVVSVNYNRFTGSGSCYVDITAFTARAQRFALFPLPSDGSVCVEGGYFNEDMRGLKQTHLHISARPIDALGNLALHIVLAVPVDAGINSFEANLTCTIPVTYEQLKNLSEVMIALASSHGDNYQIDL